MSIVLPSGHAQHVYAAIASYERCRAAARRNLARHRAAQSEARRAARRAAEERELRAAQRRLVRRGILGQLTGRVVTGSPCRLLGNVDQWRGIAPEVMGEAWLVAQQFADAPLDRCVGLASRRIRRENSVRVMRGGVRRTIGHASIDSEESCATIEHAAEASWLVSRRVDSATSERTEFARRRLPVKLIDCLLAGHTLRESAELSGLALRTAERMLAETREAWRGLARQ